MQSFPLPEHPHVAIGIATSGRAGILAELLRQLQQQSVRPDKVVISHVRPGDVAGISLDGWADGQVEFITGKQGSTVQRNAIIDCLHDNDIVLFLDDDFFPHPTYIEHLVSAFRSDDSILAATGLVLADGAKGPGLTVEDSNRILAAYRPTRPPVVKDAFNTYGCNMAFRTKALLALGTRFDERLAFYGWYEDMDFSRSLLPFGRIVKIEAAVGVHLGTKLGKTSGVRLGYSQVINSIYLARKGTYPWSHALKSVGRHVLINLIKSVRPEPYIDRRGRVRGNMIGLGDVLRNRIAPERTSLLNVSKPAS